MAFRFKHSDRPLDGYVIQRGIGRGGFGEVYYALSDSGKEVALKYLRDNPDMELRGTANVMNLKSPHLVTIFDVRQNAEGEYFIVMEYVSGPSLRDLLCAEPSGLGTQKAAFFIKELAKGLSYLHDRGIVHRDLKPGNIFYEDGYVKIGDYGLSKYISVSRHSGQTASVGTVHYMAPEVGSGNYHRGIDIYALGVILYEMLLGRVPFEGSSMGEVLMKHLTEQPEVDQLPEPFAGVLRKALAKDPKDRYQTVDEMAQDMLGVEAVRNSIAAFQPASLTTVARQMMETQAMASPHPSPQAQHPLRHPALGRAAAGPRTSLSADEFSRRLVERLGPKPAASDALLAYGKHRRRGKAGTHEPLLPSLDTVGDTWRARAGRAFIILLVMVGLSAAIAMLAGGGERMESYFFTTFFYSLALIIGVSISTLVLRRMDPVYMTGWAPRLITLGCAALPLLLAGTIVTEEFRAARPLIPAMLLTAGLVDWIKRVRHGMLGRIEFKDALLAALVGFVTTAACSEGRQTVMLLGAGIGGTTSLALQAGALFRRHAAAEYAAPSDAPAAAAPPPPREPDAYAERTAPREAQAAAQRAPAHAYDPASGSSGRVDWTPPTGALPLAPPGRLHRHAANRAFFAVLACGAFIGLFACLLLAVTQGNGDWNQISPLLSGAAALVATLIFCLGKTGRWRRSGLWMGVFRPFFLYALSAGLLATLAMFPLAFARQDQGFQFGLSVGVVAQLVFLVLFLVLRERTPRQFSFAAPAPQESPVHRPETPVAAEKVS